MDFGRQMEDSTDEAGRSQQSVMDAIQLPLIPGPHQTNQTMSNSSSLLPNGITPQFTPHFNPHQLHHHQHAPQQHMQRPDQQLQLFWANQLQEIRATTDFKNHNLPLARIKKIMKADEDVKMIAAEAPVLFSRACEMFILELTYRSWDQAEHSKRRTLQKSDIAAAIAKNQIFDFLVDIVPMAEVKETGELPIPCGEELSETIPYYYDPSRFGSMMMDVRHTEMESQGLAYIQPSREDCLPQQMQEQKHAT